MGRVSLNTEGDKKKRNIGRKEKMKNRSTKRKKAEKKEDVEYEDKLITLDHSFCDVPDPKVFRKTLHHKSHISEDTNMKGLL